MIAEVRKPLEYLILAYHRVNRMRCDALSVDSEAFRWQLAHLLSAGFRNLTLEEVADRVRRKAPTGGRYFALTFDDGYRDSHLDALPILREMGCRATFFLVTGFIGAGRLFPWDRHKFDFVDPRDCPMDEWEVHELVDAGMSIGSHTCSHPLLATVDIARAREEIERSKSMLEQRFRVPVRTFCYPAGSLNEDVVACVARAGYCAGVVTPREPRVAETMFTLKRMGIYHGTTPARFRLRVHPLAARIRDWRWR